MQLRETFFQTSSDGRTRGSGAGLLLIQLTDQLINYSVLGAVFCMQSGVLSLKQDVLTIQSLHAGDSGLHQHCKYLKRVVNSLAMRLHNTIYVDRVKII